MFGEGRTEVAYDHRRIGEGMSVALKQVGAVDNDEMTEDIVRRPAVRWFDHPRGLRCELVDRSGQIHRDDRLVYSFISSG